MAHAILDAVDAILGNGVLDGSTDDYQAVVYIIKKECALKNFEEADDIGQPAEVSCLFCLFVCFVCLFVCYLANNTARVCSVDSTSNERR